MDLTELSDNARKLELALPESLEFITDARLRQTSGLIDPEYSEAKRELVEKGLARVGRGRGGPIKRAGTFDQRVLAKLPRDGSFVSNNKIYESLNISPEAFAEIQQHLIADGKVKVGRGRYGRTARILDAGFAKPENGNGEAIGVADEYELYGPVKDYLDRKWKPNYEPSPPNLYISQITALHQKRGASLIMPCISVLTIMKYDFVPGNHLELITVDVKKQTNMGLEAVYETTSHGRYAHRSYLVFEWIEEEDFETAGPDADYVISEAKRFGIGLVQMRPVDGGEWSFKTVVIPVLKTPETGELNSFIEAHFGDEHGRIRGAVG